MEQSSKDFMPIPINEFSKGIVIPVDLFIRIGDEKFILVAKATTQSNVDQFKNYQSKEVTYLWVRKKEFYKLTHQAMSMAGISLTKKDLNDKQKTTLITHAARSMFRQLEHLGMDMEFYNHAKQITQAVLGLVESNRSFSDILLSLNGYSDALLPHSIAVSSLSVMIGSSMGFEKRATLEKLALGGLLHDVGMKAIPVELTTKSIASMTTDEIQLYETHSFKGMQMLNSIGIVPDDIVSIIYEHHENSIGQGYPQRMRDVKMHPLAKVVALSDGFADLIIPNVNCPVPKNPREALMYIEYTLGIPYNREAFRALKKAIEGKKKAGAA